MVRSNLFCIITGETGSGKTTQLAQYMVEELSKLDFKGDHDERIRVVVTQPRRVAAIQMATRVAHERDSRLGGEVGYTIRFDDHTGSSTRIKYVTDGILVRECL